MQISDGFPTSVSVPVPGLLLVILNGAFLIPSVISHMKPVQDC